jgi:hypothetical protein
MSPVRIIRLLGVIVGSDPSYSHCITQGLIYLVYSVEEIYQFQRQVRRSAGHLEYRMDRLMGLDYGSLRPWAAFEEII